MPHHWILSPTRAKVEGQVSARGHGQCSPPHHQRGQPCRGRQISASCSTDSMGNANLESPVAFPMCAASAGACHVREYERNNEGSYILEVQTSEGWVCYTPDGSIGRLMNHSSSTYLPVLLTVLQSKARSLNGGAMPTFPSC